MLTGIFEGVSLSTIVTIVGMLGPTGLVLIFWYVDHRNYERAWLEHRDEMAKVMAKYDHDMAVVTRMYEDNVILAKNYDKLSGALADIIHLNTQVQTKLVERIDNNMTCPLIREQGVTGARGKLG